MTPIEHYRDREQTYLKHLFLREYLETLAYHIGFSQREFVYVDCFAGPWRAADEALGDTSIRIALDRLKAVKSGLARVGKHPVIRAIFVEKSPSSYATLKQVLEEHSSEIRTLALPGDFEDNIERILNELGQTFAFFFVDPTGWTGFAMENLRPILKRSKGEVMINLMYDFINRFASYEEPSNEVSLDRLFGTPDWRNLRTAPNREAALVNLYVEQVRAAGNFRFATFSRILKPLVERAYFHLVYATRNGKGIEKFRAVEKKVVAEQETVRQEAQRSFREVRSGQAEMDFGTGQPSRGLLDDRAQQLDLAKQQLVSILQQGSMLYSELLPRILELPLVWPSDVPKLLRTGPFEILGLGPRETVPKSHYMIRLK